MKTFTLKRKSWHFRLAHTYGSLDQYNDLDLCTYVRQMIRGLFVVGIVIIGGGVIFGVPGGCTVGWLAACISVGQYIPPDTIAVFIPGIALAISLIGTSAYYADKWNDRRAELAELRRLNNEDEEPEVEPTALQLMYRSFKEKTCVRIKVQ